jgi:hypothetical protein
VVGSLLTAIGSFILQAKTSDVHVVEEVKICTANITKPDIAPQLREYLKERLYWNAAIWMHYRPDFFVGAQRLDFGPVDTKILGTARGIKDCSTSEEVYWAVLEKFRIQKESAMP